MQTGIGLLRRRVLTPNISETKMDVRGFHVKNESAGNLLETVGSSFLTGFGEAAEAATAQAAEHGLEQVPERFRGSPTRVPRWASPSATPWVSPGVAG